MATLRSWPRPANALPNSYRLIWLARRCGALNVLKTWSISTGSGHRLASGIVVAVLVPGRGSARSAGCAAPG